MNLQTIADAIASTIGTVTATSGTATEQATCTADLPDQVSKLALLVYPPDGVLKLIPGPRYDDQYDFMVKLLRDPLSVPARTRWLYAWASALRIRTQSNFDLGVAGVTQAETLTMRVDIDGEEYSQAGALARFDVVELGVRVWVLENATGVNP